MGDCTLAVLMSTNTGAPTSQVHVDEGFSGMGSWSLAGNASISSGSLHLDNTSSSRATHNTFVVAGGVAANESIRQSLTDLAERNNFKPLFADKKFCGDNGAMIAWACIQLYKKKLISDLDVEPKSRWPLDPTAKYMKGPGLKL